MSKVLSKRYRAVNIILRLTVIVAMLMLTIGMIVHPAFAATINQARDPSPADYVFNNGNGHELFWWSVTWDSTPTYLTHIIENPLGTVVHSDSWVISGETPPVVNPEDPTGLHYGDPGEPSFAHDWTVPAGSRPGTYTSRLRYYSEEVSGATVPPVDPLAFESESAVTFFVRQTWQLFKYSDLNGNGVYDNPPETGLDGWDFTVTGPVGTMPFPGPSNSFFGTTSAGGNLSIPDVAIAGSYTITETLKAGWRNTDPGGLSPYQKIVTIPIPQINGFPYDNTIEFGNQELGALDILCYFDHDKGRNTGCR
jgi:hypothetical protein